MAEITQILRVNINDLRAYENNARMHSDDQLKKLSASIKEFGFLSPCLIDRNNNIIAGHGRVKAAKMAGLDIVPCVAIEGLTEAQKRAYILADNKLAELSVWDEDLLAKELDAIQSFDMSDFGFDQADIDAFVESDGAGLPDSDEGYYGDERERTGNAYNLSAFSPNRAAGVWQIPTLEPVDYVPSSLIGFNYVKTASENDYDNTVHFFIDDYQFERVWNQPDQNIARLKPFDAVLTPDFSLYMDMPLCMMLWNVYRSRLFGQMCQDAGLCVIPTLQWADERSLDFVFDGLPQESTVCVSTVGVMRDADARAVWCMGMDEAIKRLNPKTIVCYGSQIDYDFGDRNVVYIEARKFS